MARPDPVLRIDEAFRRQADRAGQDAEQQTRRDGEQPDPPHEGSPVDEHVVPQPVVDDGQEQDEHGEAGERAERGRRSIAECRGPALHPGAAHEDRRRDERHETNHELQPGRRLHFRETEPLVSIDENQARRYGDGGGQQKRRECQQAERHDAGPPRCVRVPDSKSPRNSGPAIASRGSATTGRR